MSKSVNFLSFYNQEKYCKVQISEMFLFFAFSLFSCLEEQGETLLTTLEPPTPSPRTWAAILFCPLEGTAAPVRTRIKVALLNAADIIDWRKSNVFLYKLFSLFIRFQLALAPLRGQESEVVAVGTPLELANLNWFFVVSIRRVSLSVLSEHFYTGLPMIDKHSQ
jgi:hypothetical protein